MPTIPIYDAPQVKAQGLPDTQLRVNVPNMAAPIAQGLGAVSAMAQQKADEAQVSVVNEATRKVREDLNGLTEFVATVKDPRNPKNWGGREGQSLQGWFEEQAKALIESQRNGIPPSALDRFDSSVLPVAETMRHTVSTHEANLFDQVHDDTYNANMGAARQSVALTAVDPKGRLNQAAVTINEQDIKQQVAEIGRRKQWSPEKIRAEEIRQLSPTHAIVVQGLLDAKNMEAARNYFATAKADMTPETMRELSARVEVGTDYEIGDTLYNKYVPGLTIENYAERQKQINQEDSLKTRPQIRAHVLQMLHAVVAADMAAKKERVDAATDKVASVAFTRGFSAAISSPEMQILHKLDPSVALQRKAQFEAEIRARKNESSPEDYVDAFFKKERLLNSEGFLFMTEKQLKQEIMGMPKQMQAETINTWDAYRNNAKLWEGDKRLVKDYLAKAGIMDDPENFAPEKTEKGKAQRRAFSALSNGLTALYQESGRAKPPSLQQQQAELERLTADVVVGKGFFGGAKKMKTFEITSKLQDPVYKPVRAQLVKSAYNNGTGLNLPMMTAVYARAMQEGKLLPTGYIEQSWLNGQPEILGKRRPKYADLPPQQSLGDPVADLRKLVEGGAK